ncbi:hypothetical protein RDWZM_007578 [Blomia tropicalis]|uniref:Protein HIRA n=1 Tax=Blomia tropicalis TaxID=40697 RepID=A0A9Q0M013_BLOTA|nr:hypothetical protein BLOT_011472 [Blomia tropicalis]KAJ6216421.1 hypothetical protein RDWZM_007578 [Blomia tropicalis]
MRIVKPNWVTHGDKGNDFSIFSIDIHPDGSKVATGGQGPDCGRVTIWNMTPIISKKDELKNEIPKLFCQIDSHLQCVNVVRWSNSGSYLASAGDDQLIMIWTLSGRHAGPGPIEQYKIVSTLRSHSGDILDLNWSYDDQLLASCSIDNMIVVWNTQRWPEIVTTLKGHSGMVKGVTWDPVGKYLASQSDDKTLRVWRVSDWSEETVITQPFEQCGGTTHVLRLSWSPDGQFLVSAQAMNNCGSVAKIIERQDWSSEKDFAGHRKAIPCVRCNPNLFKKKDENKDSKSINQCIVALGSRDRSISIWATAIPRPVLVLSDIFQNSVLDMSWSKNGYQLMACSNDGTVAYLEFSEDEFGQQYSEEERCQYMQQLYGTSVGNKSAFIYNLIEDMDIMLLHKPKQNGNGDIKDDIGTTVTNPDGGNSNSSLVTTNKGHMTNSCGMRLAKGPTDKQIEIRSADGRRRIIPLFIPPITDATATAVSTSSTILPVTASNPSQPISFSSSRESKSKIVIETRDESNPPTEYMTYVSVPQTNGTCSDLSKPDSMPTKQSNNEIAIGEKENNLETVPATEKKSSSSKKDITQQERSKSPKPQEKGTTNGNCKSKRIDSSSESSNEGIVIRRQKSITVKRKSIDQPAPNIIQTKRKPGRPPGSSTNQTKSESNSKNNSQQPNELNQTKAMNIVPTVAEVPTSNQPVSQSNSLASSRTPNPSSKQRNGLYFPPLKLSKHSQTSIRLFTCPESHSVFTASVENPLSSSSFSKLSVLKDDQPCWSVLLSTAITSLTANQHILTCICDDRTMNIFNSATGSRINVPIMLESQIARMVCANKSHILLITCNAHIWLWDVLLLKVLIKGESLLPLLIHPKTNEQLSILNATVTPNGKPIISVSNGRTFIFENDLSSWCLVADSSDPLNACTDLKPTAISSYKNMGTLSKIPSRSLMNYFSTNTHIAQHGLISFIEQQIEASKAVVSAKDYRFWVLSLVQNLVSMHSSGFNVKNIESRLRDLCNFLLGHQFPRMRNDCSTMATTISSTPIPGSRRLTIGTSTTSNASKILGLSKHELLREILSVLASNLSLQRLYIEFKEQLDSFSPSVSLNSTYLNMTRLKPQPGCEPQTLNGSIP